ncbi:MAG: ATP-binding domain-containing protein [Planctomycetaceae bacterium]|nr:ATP-binding domain-containing protein [Planctomycetaceae bacterium]
MAEFFPKVPYEVRGEGAERASNEPELVMRACLEEALADRPWIVIQNLLVQDPDSIGTRELDFVVIDPDRGLIVIEVKGGDYRFDAENGWHRRVRGEVRQFDRDAPSQAVSSMHALVRALAHYGSHDERRPPYLHGWFLALVDAHVDFDTVPISARKHVLSANHCRSAPRLRAEIDEMFEALARRFPDVPLGEASPMRRIVSRHILPSMKSALYVSDEIANARVVEHDVMRPVRGIVDATSRLDRVNIEGYAGTGKTYAALHRARKELAAGRRTLVTCFNEPLASTLGRAIGARPIGPTTPLREIRADRIVVANLHNLATAAANGVGRTPPNSLPLGERYDLLIEILASIAREGGLGDFDSIVIDEGQDFTLPMLDAIDALGSAGVRIAFFHDPLQAIYGAPATAEIERRFGRPLVLRENLRNSVSITAFLRSLDPERLCEIDAPPSVREGQQVVVAEFASDDTAGQRDAIRRIVRFLVDEEGVRPEDIVLLSPFRQGRGVMSTIDIVAGIPLVSLGDALVRSEDDPPCLRWETLHRFKGLEAPAVILHDVRGSGPNVELEAIYTACSRAQHALYVLRTDDYAGGAPLPIQGSLPD